MSSIKSKVWSHGNRKERSSRSFRNEDSAIGYITVYKYGKMFTPALGFHKQKAKVQRSVNGSASALFDRPGLISTIHHLLAVHRKQRVESANNHCWCSVKSHRELMSVIRTCYEQNICESRLYPVGELFLELFLCTGSSVPVYCLLTDDRPSSKSLYWTERNILYPESSSDTETAFEYYLHHISSLVKHENKSLDFMNKEIDSVSGMTPLSAAIQKRDPALVLILLRYGANPFLSSSDSSVGDRIQNPTEQLIDDLNGLFLFKNTGFSKETCDKLAAEEAKVWQCLTYFRRAVLGIPVRSSTHIVTSFDDDDNNKSDAEYIDDRFLAKQMYGIHPGIAKFLDFDYFKPTVSLKHQCRYAIRHQLKQNKHIVASLPMAIKSLPLPEKLKTYLDLQND